MNNLQTMKSLTDKKQIEVVLKEWNDLLVFTTFCEEPLKFSLDDFYEFLKEEGYVKDYGSNEEYQYDAYAEYPYWYDDNEVVFNYIQDELATIERRKRLATAKLPDLANAFQKLKGMINNKVA